MRFNEFIKKCREDVSLTQEEAAKAIGVGTSTVQNWERLTSYPERVIIGNIAKAYRVSTKRIFEALGDDYELTNDVIDSVGPKIIPFKDLLPDDLDYSSVLGLEFNEKEQDMFLIFALNVTFGANPVPEILKKYPNPLDLALFIDKLKKYNLFTIEKQTLNGIIGDYKDNHVKGNVLSHSIDLTSEGRCVYTLIKSQRYSLFSIYNLGFADFLTVLDNYKVIDKKCLVDTIDLLLECDVHYLEEFKKNPDRYRSNQSKEIKVSLPIYGEIKKIDASYYIIEEEEPTDEVYKMEKELYLKKLDFYEKNKENYEGIIAPEPFLFKEVKVAKASEKAKRFKKALAG